MKTELTHVENHAEDSREWIALGEEGAITFLVWPGDKAEHGETACVIGIHSARKLATMPRLGKCHILPGGHCYEQVKLAEAGKLWVFSSHGENVKMIWEVLGSWYNATFGRTGETGPRRNEKS